MIDLDAAERTLLDALAVIRELRAAAPSENAPIELPEKEMAERLGVDPAMLRSYRRSGSAPAELYRPFGRNVLWLVAQTEKWACDKFCR